MGGFILLFYLGLVFFLRYVQLGWQNKPLRDQVWVWGKQYVLQVLGISLIAYVLMLLFWPRALIDPFVYPFHVLRVFSNFTYYVTTFFEGAEITWIEIPWYYVPKWLSMIVPEFVFLGLLCGFLLVFFIFFFFFFFWFFFFFFFFFILLFFLFFDY